MEALLTLIGTIGVVAILIIYGSLSWGFVSYTLYNWFILPVFPELPHFTVTQFIGFSLFANTIIRHSSVYIKDEYKEKSTEYAAMVLNPWLVLLFAWLLKIVLF